MPHTVEEAYELAGAAASGDDSKLLDELGDVLFQVHFLSLLLEERGAGDLAAVAEHCAQKLVRRHPHVFGEVEAADAAQVLRNWDQIKRAEEGGPPGSFGDLPGNLPALVYTRKVQRRAAGAGDPQPDMEAALARVVEEARRLGELPGRDATAASAPADRPSEADPGGGRADAGAPAEDDSEPGPVPSPDDPARAQRFDAVGELLYAAVAAARELAVDAELALRAAADRRRERVEAESAEPPSANGAPIDEDSGP